MKLTELSAIALTVLASHLIVFAGSNDDRGYVAHEWGTFTSVQGADGVPQPWHPLITSELPSFVYDRSGGKASGKDISQFKGSGKSAFIALQRMETPVIYFYSDRERTVRASVLFPKGQITEWYPIATGPATTAATDVAALRNGPLRWDNLKLLSPTSGTPSPSLPEDGRGSHYYAARETDANLLQVAAGKENKLETEKFLFYRGVGWFTTPLHVTMEDETSIHLRNEGNETLAHLFVVEMNQGKVLFQHLPKLAPKQTLRVALPGTTEKAAQDTAGLATALREALTADGLYPREAAAMVATWKESWFGEDGLRVLYLLPRTWTDEILPLELSPKPTKLVRTMVGRAEVIQPSVERLLAEKIRSFGAATGEERQQVAAETRALGLGRFLEPAVRRAQAHSQSEEFQRWAGELLEIAGRPTQAAEDVRKPERVAAR